MMLGPIRHLLYKATSLRLGDIMSVPSKYRELSKTKPQKKRTYQRDKKFKVVIIKMFFDLRRMGEHSENFNS